jgi:uncharacterized protein (TIGR03437 family)
MSRAPLFFLLTLAPVALLAEANAPSIRFTGVPSDGGQTCATCHSGGNSGSITVMMNDYNPGIQQTIRIILQHPQAQRWGFQMTIRQVSDETKSAGDFSVAFPTDPVQVMCDNGSRFGSAPPCISNAPQFIEHKDAPRSTAGAGFEFDVVWSPPAQEVGDLNVYVTAVAADGTGTPAGDSVLTFVRRISNVGGCSLRRPSVQTALNGASFKAPFSSSSLISIFGFEFQTSGRTRGVGLGDLVNNVFPTTLGCVAVEVTGPGFPQPTRLPIAYVQQDQINAQLPAFTGAGPVTLIVITNAGRSNEFRSDVATLTALQSFAPAFFLFSGSNSIAAQFAGTSRIVARPSLVPGAAPARPGDIVTLYGTGFGATSPSLAAGQIASGVATLTTPVTVTIGGVTLPSSDVSYAGLSPGSISGLYQINVKIPSTATGDAPVVITIGGSETQAGAFIPVQ